MKITIDLIKKAALIVGGIFFSSLSIIKADDNTQSGLTPEMLLPQFTNMTPEAASLGKYGAFQVSEYSGTANISIPLYTVKSGDVSFLINLYYDATGIKVEQDATFVGLGWNISYGGMISHIVCGEDDFLQEFGYQEFEQNWWTNKINEIKPKIPNDAPFIIGNYIDEQMYETFPYGRPEPGSTSNDYVSSHYMLADEGYRSKEMKLYDRMANGYDVPDVFQASFCGHNISFTIDKRTRKASKGPYPIIILNNNPQKYKISYNTDEINDSFSGYPTSFVITDDKGITYCFEAFRENLDKGERIGCGFDSYYLSMIYGPDGKDGKSVVKFEYIQKKFGFESSRVTIKEHKPTTKLIGGPDGFIPKNVAEVFSNYKQSYYPRISCNNNNSCYKVYPSRIITRLDTIEFDTTDRSDIPDAKCISRITVKHNSGNSTRKIEFHYSNFSETPVYESHKSIYSHRRLKLVGVTIDNQNYNFEYDNRELPSFASYSKDYWGYYNGANKKDLRFTGCSPAYMFSDGIVSSAEHHLDGSNRLASENLCNVGMLKKIIYPTGGYTLYEFESNRFNDRYYYPDASRSADILKEKSDFECNINGNEGVKSTSKTFEVDKETKYKLYASVSSAYGQKDASTIILKNIAGSELKSLSSSNGIEKDSTFDIILSKGKYIIEVTLTVDNKDGVPSYIHATTAAHCILSHKTDVYVASTNGGSSIGGGLRIRTIKNYDSDNTYLNGVKYEYSGGKLLSPTVQLEKHYVKFKHDSYSRVINFSFLYANTEPSYPYICSLGVPATVGYDRVVKKEIDESEKVTYRRTVLEFHNYGYDLSSHINQMNELMQNAFYFPSTAQGNLTNGLIKNDSIFDGSVLISTTHYDYKGTRLDTIYYQKCLPLHLPVEKAVKDWNLAFFRKCNTWSYLTSKTETLYDNNGEQTMSNTTQYEYNSSNYQLSQQTVSNGVDSVRTNYWYPTDKKVLSDKKVEGYEELNKIHNISEVTAIDTYRNGTFTGGSQFDFRKWTKTKLPVPVVDKCYSITPFNDKILEMKVDETYGYDNYGNIRQYNKKDGTPVTIIWSYNHQLPIMEIVGKTYSQVKTIYAKVADLEKDDISTTDITTKTNELHEALKAEGTFATAYLYSPWHTVSEIIKPNGDRLKYSYDKYGRLEKTSDVNNKILQKYSYNYKEKIK